MLPDHYKWDYTIRLISSAKSKTSKIYLLFSVKQSELNTFIKKNDSSFWLVQDYRTFNVITIKNKYLLSLISELVTKLQEAYYFTKLDVCWGFNNIHTKLDNEWKIAFCINHRIFESLVIFFSITNSPATF